LKPLIGLLPNWRQHVPSDGKIYYVNVKTKEVTYTKPVDDGFSYGDTDEAPPPPVEDIPLPPSWKEAFAPDGRTYYFNTSTKQTTWSRPTL